MLDTNLTLAWEKMRWCVDCSIFYDDLATGLLSFLESFLGGRLDKAEEFLRILGRGGGSSVSASAWVPPLHFKYLIKLFGYYDDKVIRMNTGRRELWFALDVKDHPLKTKK